MNSGSQPQGFTIIEVLIVLSLASFLFVAASLALGGDQKQTEFNTGARQIFTQLQSLSSDVQNGLYTSNPVACSSNSGSPIFSSNSQAQEGTNTGCVYVGKAIQFNPSTASSSFYYVYSLIGNQFQIGSLNPPVLPFPYSAKVLASVGLANTYPPIGTQTVNLPDSFTVSKINYGNTTSNYIVGFYNIESSGLSTNSSLTNQLFIMPISSASSPAIAVLNLNNDANYNVNPTSILTVCFTSPIEPNQAVQISFENQSNSTNLTLSYSYKGC